MKIKTFFYGLKLQESTEQEINDFLADQNIVVEKILQSAAGISADLGHANFIDIAVAITIVYSEK